MTLQPASTEEEQSLKDQGNKLFAAEQWLAAAATYTKALKQDPDNAVLFSNRSAALLKLQKVGKALADAEQCIQLKPEWEKGYFRKAAALEAGERLEEALHVYQQAAKLPSAGQVASGKAALLTRQLQRQRQQASKHSQPGGSSFGFEGDKSASQQPKRKQKGGASSTNNKAQAGGQVKRSAEAAGGRLASAPVVGTISDDASYEAARQEMASNKVIPISDERIAEFQDEILQEVHRQIASGGITEPCVYFLPGTAGQDGKEKLGRVSISAAFDSPETRAQAQAFLQQYASDSHAHAACAVVPKASIAYPQVWKNSRWQYGTADGVFLQMESLRPARKLLFLPADAPDVHELELLDAWLLERLFV